MRISIARWMSAWLPIVAVSALQAQAPQPQMPDGAGKATVERVCSTCHPPTHVLTKEYTRAEWRELVDGMLYGPEEVSEKDRETIVAYLLANFPKSVNVNTADTAELQKTLDISAADAQAIVAFRTAQGPIRTEADLAKIPGWNSARIEPIRKRLQF